VPDGRALASLGAMEPVQRFGRMAEILMGLGKGVPDSEGVVRIRSRCLKRGFQLGNHVFLLSLARDLDNRGKRARFQRVDFEAQTIGLACRSHVAKELQRCAVIIMVIGDARCLAGRTCIKWRGTIMQASPAVDNADRVQSVCVCRGERCSGICGMERFFPMRACDLAARALRECRRMTSVQNGGAREQLNRLCMIAVIGRENTKQIVGLCRFRIAV